MDLNRYIKRHLAVEEELKFAVEEINKVVAKYLLQVLKVVKSSKNESVAIKKQRIRSLFSTLYRLEVLRKITDFGGYMIDENIKWESKEHGKVDDDIYNEMYMALFGKVLIDKYLLRTWLTRESKKNTDKVMIILNDAMFDDSITDSEIEKQIISYFKAPLNNVRKLMDAVAFSALFLVRDKIMKANKIELMEWSSVLDKKTTEGCILRDGLIYTVKEHKPYGHDVPWRIAGVYHWGCRSFMVPYE